MFQSTNKDTEKEVKQDLDDVVINQHQVIHVKLCLTDIQVMESQSNMEKKEGKTCLLIWGPFLH